MSERPEDFLFSVVRRTIDTAVCATSLPWPASGAQGSAAILGRLDRVLLAIALIFAGLAVALPRQALDSLTFAAGSLWSIAPFFALSVVLAALLSATGSDRQLARAFKGHRTTAILLAGVFGTLSPFCSVSVIPAIAVLLAARVPLAPIMAFWIGSPLMDPEQFILTGAIISWPFALVRTIAAVALAVAAGFLTEAVAGHPAILSPLRPGLRPNPLGNVWNSACSTPMDLDDPQPINWWFWRDRKLLAAFIRHLRSIGWFVFKWLFLAFVIQSLIAAYVPAEDVARLLGGDQWWLIPGAVALGTPTYLNGYAAIPLIDELLDKGMQPGAALAFMIGGEITSIPTAMSVFILVNRWVFAWYLLLGLLGSIVVGFAYRAALG
jgi:hypothetical protein